MDIFLCCFSCNKIFLTPNTIEKNWKGEAKYEIYCSQGKFLFKSVSLQHSICWRWCICSCSFSLKSNKSRRPVRKSEWIHVSFVSQRYVATWGLHPAGSRGCLLSGEMSELILPVLTATWAAMELGKHFLCIAQMFLGIPLQTKTFQKWDCFTWKYPSPWGYPSRGICVRDLHWSVSPRALSVAFIEMENAILTTVEDILR